MSQRPHLQNTITLGIQLQHVNFGGNKHSVYLALSDTKILPNELLLNASLYESMLIESNEIFIWTFPMIFQIFPQRPLSLSLFFHPALNWMWEQGFLFLMTWRSILVLGSEGNTDSHMMQNQQLFLAWAARFITCEEGGFKNFPT